MTLHSENPYRDYDEHHIVSQPGERRAWSEGYEEGRKAGEKVAASERDEWRRRYEALRNAYQELRGEG